MAQCDDETIATEFRVTVRHREKYDPSMLKQPIRDGAIIQLSHVFRDPEWVIDVAEGQPKGAAEG